MNPYLVIGALIVWGVTFVGGYGYGHRAGVDRTIASQASADQIRRDTIEAANQGAAAAISKIEVKNVTINRKLETEVREKAVFRDCRSGPDSVRIYNSGVPGYSEPAGGGELPAKDAPAR